MKILIILDIHNGVLSSSNYALVTAGKKLDEDITALAIGQDIQQAVEKAQCIQGIKKILWVEDPIYTHPTAETICHLILQHAKNYDAILSVDNSLSKNFVPRLAALLDIQPLSDIIDIISPTQFRRPIYAGNAIATISTQQEKLIATIRQTAFKQAEVSSQPANIEKITPAAASTLSFFVKQQITASERPDLKSANIVVSGGRGLQSKENFSLIEKLADCLKAAIGATRAAVDAGYISNDHQVGQTGKIIAPQLYIAIGISGAIQHLAGMKESKIIVAINQDENAPIFQIADYGLVMDLFQAVPALIEALKK